MTYSVSQAWVDQFSDNITTLAQQTVSILGNTVMKGTSQGEYKFFDRLGSVTLGTRSASNESSSFSDMAHTKRAVSFSDYFFTTYVDDRDLKRMLIDPQSAYVTQAVAAFKRKVDEVIIAAATADAKQGRATGASFTTVSYDTANQTVDVKFAAGDPIGAGNGTGSWAGLTLAKILKGRAALLSANALLPGERIFCAVGPDEEIDLMNITQFASRDYRMPENLPYELGIDPTGIIGEWVGVTFLRSNLLATVNPSSASNAYRRCLMYVPSCIGFVDAGDLKVKVAPNPERSFTNAIHVEGSMGAARIHENKIVEIRTNSGITDAS